MNTAPPTPKTGDTTHQRTNDDNTSQPTQDSYLGRQYYYTATNPTITHRNGTS